MSFIVPILTLEYYIIIILTIIIIILIIYDQKQRSNGCSK